MDTTSPTPDLGVHTTLIPHARFAFNMIITPLLFYSLQHYKILECFIILLANLEK